LHAAGCEGHGDSPAYGTVAARLHSRGEGDAGTDLKRDEAMTVRTWMTPDPQTIGPQDSLAAAQEKMGRGRFRRLPVVDASGALLGILTERDLRQHIGYLPTTHVNAAMTEKALTIGPDEPIESAAALMLERKIGGLPVVGEDGKLLGIVTVTDLLQGLLHGVGGSEDTSGRIDLRLVSPQQTVAEAVQTIESAGAIILGLGTQRSTAAAERTFYVRLLAPDLAPLAELLRQRGYAVEAVHPPRAA
jgi:acetoin utilization protein AcuB